MCYLIHAAMITYINFESPRYVTLAIRLKNKCKICYKNNKPYSRYHINLKNIQQSIDHVNPKQDNKSQDDLKQQSNAGEDLCHYLRNH